MIVSDAARSLIGDGGKFLLGSVVGALITQRVKGKAKLISHWGNTSAFVVRPADGEPFVIHTHDVVIRNAGRKAATKVRVSHRVLPEQFNVFPSIPYEIGRASCRERV